MNPWSAVTKFLSKVSFNLRHHARQPHPVRSLAADLLARAGWSGRFTFVHAGSRLRLRPAGLSRILWVEPGRELDGESFLRAFLRAGDGVVDVGANIGVHALLASRLVGESGRVLAIEAHPATFRALEDNLRLNARPNIDAVCAAAGPGRGRVRFSDRADDDWNQVGSGGTLEVEQLPLDEIAAALPAVTLIKIDVEGYELPSLRGASALLARSQCVVLEYWHEHTRHFGYQLADLLALLGKFGFHAWSLEENQGRVTVTPWTRTDEPAELLNLVLVRDASLLQRIAAGAGGRGP